MPSDPDQLLTAIDASRILGLSTDMVRVLTRKGRLASIRAANGYHLFRRGDVERLAEERARERTRGRSAAPAVAKHGARSPSRGSSS
ncbi:helix-turn-helix domain-containing protein [Archangium sp.]|uniref:helix-turn-helix domain-containing protein n=1 Tax=Archangium sp. TaxID=1872627 RepID=UPI0039C88175